jgi:(E)-4-hydroxy-3-methylbut-2-enyl-diphosphate synthase
MENEVIAAREICNAAAELVAVSGNIRAAARETARLRRGGVTVISCPRCGRSGFDTHGFTSRWLSSLYSLNRRITVAIMGCEVNGPQEARHADLGITGSGNKVLIFRHGEVVRTVSAEEADTAFEQELEQICNQRLIFLKLCIGEKKKKNYFWCCLSDCCFPARPLPIIPIHWVWAV